MTFDNPAEVDSITYQMKNADFVRAQNRARIDNLFNGFPPYTPEDVARNNIQVNVNHLEGTVLAHEARTQFYGAFLKPGHFFTARTDWGPVHKRQQHGVVVSKEVNRPMKRSMPYLECHRSKIAQEILHGVGPGAFRNDERWCPQMIGMEDILIPAMTLLTMENLPLFAIYRSYTAPELIKLTRGPERDPGWNMDLVQACIEYVDEQTMSLLGTNWPEIWSPEKAQERIKGDGGFYSGDQVATINCWDFYYWDDSKKADGWRRRIILDAWSMPSGPHGEARPTRKNGKAYEMGRRAFLYDGKDRVFAKKLEEIITFRFADLSAVAPFRYHSVRALGFLLYAICHLQNRMRCKFSEAVFEALMMYFRVKDMNDAQRSLKLNLISRGFIDETIQFVPPDQRWQVDAELVKLGLLENSQIIAKNSASYITSPQMPADKREKTRFEVMAELNAMTSLVSAALTQAYSYQTFEYREIFRRFMKKGSSDPDVRTFQANCLRQGVPAKLLTAEAWDIEPERVIGGGNKTLEMAIAQQLMEYRPLFDPESQRQILRDVTMTITDDPSRAQALVPEQPKISDSVHDGQLAAGPLMQGLPVSIKSGINRTEYIEALLVSMATTIQQIRQTDNVGTPDKLNGLQNMGQHIAQNIQILAQDQSSKQLVREYSEQLSELSNLVKGFQQRLMEQMEKAMQNGGPPVPGADPEAMQKAKNQAEQARIKQESTRESHAQRTAQRQIQFEMKQQQEEAKFQQKLRQEELEFRRSLMAEGAERKQEMVITEEEADQQLELERRLAEQKIESERKKADAAAKAKAKQAKATPKK